MAPVTQPCVATLAPVRTRIDEPVLRRYRADTGENLTASEIEMPEDDTIEPLPDVVDLSDVFRKVAFAGPAALPARRGCGHGQSRRGRTGRSPR